MQTSISSEQQAAPRRSRIKDDSTFKLINSLDLAMVKRKLMDPTEGKDWTQEKVDAVEVRYKRYLYMTTIDVSHQVVPTRDVDAFWHQHILDTRAYASDCMRVFGEFLHHFPYLGMRGEEDLRLLEQSFAQTCVLYHRLFGEEYEGDAVECGKGACAKCGSGYCSS